MPYHIFKIFPNQTLELEKTLPDFKSANKYVKQRRGEIVVADNYLLKMVFAATAEAGVKLLTTEREYIPHEDDF